MTTELTAQETTKKKPADRHQTMEPDDRHQTIEPPTTADPGVEGTGAEKVVQDRHQTIGPVE